MSATCQLLQRLRQAGLTQFEIARRSGIPQPTLSRWENGEVAKAADAALKLKELELELALIGCVEGARNA
jgi:transcriptional regulator with XRE-family HTH domain